MNKFGLACEGITDHIVLQLDTDIIEHPNFGLSYRNDQGIELF